MPDRQKDLNESVFIVTSSVTGKQNATKEPVMRRMETSKLENSNRTQMMAPTIIENSYARFAGTVETPPNTVTSEDGMPPHTTRYQMKNRNGTKRETRDGKMLGY